MGDTYIQAFKCPILNNLERKDKGQQVPHLPLEILVQIKDGKPIAVRCNEYKKNENGVGCSIKKDHKAGKEIYGKCFCQEEFKEFYTKEKPLEKK